MLVLGLGGEHSVYCAAWCTANMQMGLCCSLTPLGEGGREGAATSTSPLNRSRTLSYHPPNFSLHGRHDGNYIIFWGTHARMVDTLAADAAKGVNYSQHIH